MASAADHRERFKLIAEVHVLLLRDEQVLLSRRHNTGYEDGKYSLIAGHMDGGEAVKAAAIREAREEAGIDIHPGELEVVGVMHRRATDERIGFFLHARAWSGEIRNAEPDKCSDLRWFPVDRLPDNLVPYVRRALALSLGQRHLWFDSFGWS